MTLNILRNAVVAFVVLTTILSRIVVLADDSLVGHWKLANDAKDYSGRGNDGVAHNVEFAAGGPDGNALSAARFDGRRSYIEAPNSASLNLGQSDFTVAAWVYADEGDDDAVGDIVSKFDAATRSGFSWCIKNSPGVSGSQANYRNLHFGVDAGTTPRWTDCGRLGSAVYVMALAVHDGDLYAGTCEPAQGEAGHVYRHARGDQWVDCGSPDGSNAVTVLAEHRGKLYAGTGRYNVSGSALPASPNNVPGGKVFAYDGDGTWTHCGHLDECDAVGGLVVYRGDLYATTMYHPAGMYRYLKNNKWERCNLPRDGRRVVSPTVFNEFLYVATYDGCAVYRFDGDVWSDALALEPGGQTYSLEVAAGQLQVGTWPSGHVYRTSDGTKWIDSGRLGTEDEVMGMAVYNGKLYGGTLPLAQVYRYDGDGAWTLTGRLDHTPDVRFRRAWSMAVQSGRLFCGNLPSGHVHAMSAGECVTYDRALKAGWRHLVATRREKELTLYVDGEKAATSMAAQDAVLDVNNDSPLLIGFGGHDYFHGCLSDVRIYNRALSPSDVAHLAKLPAESDK